MLNRHHLRIKVLQSLYGLELAKNANYQLAEDLIEEAFTPDWDEKKENQIAELAKKKQFADAVFENYFQNPEVGFDTKTDSDIYKAAGNSLSFYQNQSQKDTDNAHKNLILQTEKIYELYLFILSIIPDLADFLKEDKTLSGFAQNAIAKILKNSTKFQNLLLKKGIQPEKRREILETLVKNFLKDDAHLINYLQKETHDLSEDKELISYILKNTVFSQKNQDTYRISDLSIERGTYEKLLKEKNTEEIIIAIEKSARLFLQEMNLPGENYFEKISQNLQKSLSDYVKELKKKPSQLLNQQNKDDNSRNKSQEFLQMEKEIAMKRAIVENLLFQSIREFVTVISSFLAEINYNHIDFQPKILKAFEAAFAGFFEDLGISWTIKNKISIHIQSEKINSPVYDYFLEMFLYWEEDVKTIQDLVQKTIKNINVETPENIELQALSKNWEDDKLFFSDLFKKSVANDRQYEQIIISKAQNWDLSRLALIDKIILKMAICEMIHFYSIPVKVSINEYIELSKQYSTEKSKQFINGLLDAISIDLLTKGLIKKSGRGLMDNK